MQVQYLKWLRNILRGDLGVSWAWNKPIGTLIAERLPVRIATNPIISTVGWTLPALVNGELLTSLVLGLPTLAPIFLKSLLTEDMYLAGSIVFVLSTLTVLGTLLSDLPQHRPGNGAGDAAPPIAAAPPVDLRALHLRAARQASRRRRGAAFA